jgi:hypothetical protein
MTASAQELQRPEDPNMDSENSSSRVLTSHPVFRCTLVWWPKN